MERLLRHLALHRIAGTELRVVSDVDGGVIPMVEVEDEVIRGYAGRLAWPHRWVTLFILRDLQPVVRHVAAGNAVILGGITALDRRPVINVYDLANPARCHVFVNQRVMAHAGYWGDPLATKGLLAHEHAHPLTETPLVRASRRLKVERAERLPEPAVVCAGAGPGPQSAAVSGKTSRPYDSGPDTGEPRDRRGQLDRRIALLLDTLCICAPRELLANELAIRSGFHDALLHLNREAIATAARSLGGRQVVVTRVRDEVRAGALSPACESLLLLVGDLEGYLTMALEVAAFLRAGRTADAQELEASLHASVLSALDPEVAVTFRALRDQYVGLAPGASPHDLLAWSTAVARVIAAPLRRAGWDVCYRAVDAA